MNHGRTAAFFAGVVCLAFAGYSAVQIANGHPSFWFSAIACGGLAIFDFYLAGAA